MLLIQMLSTKISFSGLFVDSEHKMMIIIQSSENGKGPYTLSCNILRLIKNIIKKFIKAHRFYLPPDDLTEVYK